MRFLALFLDNADPLFALVITPDFYLHHKQINTQFVAVYKQVYTNITSIYYFLKYILQCGWNDWLSGSCRGATVRPVQAWKSDVKLTSSSSVLYIHQYEI